MLDILGHNPEHTIALLPERLIPGCIGAPLPIVHAAIHFHNELGRGTVEIGNDKSTNPIEINQDRALPQETPTLEPMPAQVLPEQSLASGGILAQLPGVLDGNL